MYRYLHTLFLFFLSATLNADPGKDWPAYGGAPGGGHYSTATQINKKNVSDLELAWTHRSGDFIAGTQNIENEITEKSMRSRPTSFMNTPIMVQDTLYYCTPFNRVFALDPGTGEERWSFDPKVDMGKELLSNCRAVSSWLDPEQTGAACQHRILLGTLDARIIALDGATGKPCEDFGNKGQVDLAEGLTEHIGFEYSVTSAPAIIGDLLVTGAFVLDSNRPDVPSGVVRAYNIRTGEFLWGWNPVHPNRPQTDTDGNYVAGSTNVWSTISVDTDRGLVIVPTGNSSPDYYGGDRDGHLDYYSSSVVALSAETGEVVWHYQTVHHDIWDYDVPAQPTFVDLTIDGTTRPAVVQVTKMGMTFVLDRETGVPLHPVEERPVPQTNAVPGEYLSPTQPFPLKPEPLHQLGMTADDAWGITFWDEGSCRERLESITTGPIYTPPSLKGTVFFPSPLGGHNWGAPAIDLDRKIMITNTKHLPIEMKLARREDCPAGLPFPQNGSPYCVITAPILSSLGAPCSKPPWATLDAIDLTSGDILWRVPLGTLEKMVPWPFYLFVDGGMEMGGPIVTRSGLIFIAATSDAYIRAFDIDNGGELWKAELPTSGNAVPMTYSYKGSQYVVIAAGGHFTSPLPSGDHVLAFKLPN
ncbi:MAG TPA: pyrroloquinoline quinone-dependent dehydrogenase [Pseudomonadales bacterium]|jgi:quinoprotein glucose dehydrogenase|nr:glucose dehydrogenase [Gammaproteobacteria bacterium]MDP6027867.1 pyrroloquinoline quinone-dependent dehydrogenase [Pseudomonadales bacterium]MDP6316174.1 pyrroloquinoline quinone-dependent dehydrogenase [Pseudomonadales bacterium]MDP7315644.1 pyrroloquinoline quinone-dependent dehydrogenase [Pseudomonadales bacterium]HJP50767.1 pyrroloquinoline quinone-dependent dehydrogenase [Pseudomonadales bacterium]|tara:strand:+ start:29707 stop:31632 length:1926 start_codon:yes stop_codon:yes gene_type:complete